MQIDGLQARVLTTAVDYIRFYALVWLSVRWATDEGGEAALDPLRTAILPPLLVTSHSLMEWMYASVLGPKTISILKRDRLFEDVKSRKMMAFLFLLLIQLGLVTGLSARFGIFEPVRVPGAGGLKDWVSALALPYCEFWMISALKDLTAMNVFHRMMHNKKNKFLYSIHKQHHEFRCNLNGINGAQIHGLDLLIEDMVGPFLLVAVKVAVGLPASVTFLSFLFLVSCEGSAHSCNPYSVCYYVPIADAVLKSNVAHNLHHARPGMNALFVPWHHLLCGYGADLELYNKIMKTEVKM